MFSRDKPIFFKSRQESNTLAVERLENLDEGKVLFHSEEGVVVIEDWIRDYSPSLSLLVSLQLILCCKTHKNIRPLSFKQTSSTIL